MTTTTWESAGTTGAEREEPRAHASPPLGVLAIVFVALFVASVAATAIATSGAPYPTPYRPLDELQSWYTRFSGAVRLSAFLQLCASIPLGLFTATIVSRLRFHRVTAAGVHIALFGGVAASIFLGVSALSAWTLSQPGVASDAGALRVAQLLQFSTGGFAHTATLGLLLAGVSVPGLAFRLLPRWVGWLGLVVAGIAELSLIAMLAPAASLLLPLARFPALVWLVAAGFTLPKARR